MIERLGHLSDGALMPLNFLIRREVSLTAVVDGLELQLAQSLFAILRQRAENSSPVIACLVSQPLLVAPAGERQIALCACPLPTAHLAVLD